MKNKKTVNIYEKFVRLVYKLKIPKDRATDLLWTKKFRQIMKVLKKQKSN